MRHLIRFFFGWMLTPPRSTVREKVRAAYTLRVAKKYGVHPSVEDRLNRFRNAEGYSFPHLDEAA